jgi:hypothetical protein
MVSLRVGVRHVLTANALNFVEQRALAQCGLAQLGPVAPAAASNHVVNRGKGETLVIEMAMKHGFNGFRGEIVWGLLLMFDIDTKRRIFSEVFISTSTLIIVPLRD